MIKPSAVLVIRTLAVDSIREVFMLPFWWYTSGMIRTLKWTLSSIKGAPRFFGLDVWVKNIFVPMYGDTSFVGRLVSFGVRSFMVLGRGIASFLLMIVILLATIGYAVILPILLYLFVTHLFGILI